jgi:hypothetical protein
MSGDVGMNGVNACQETLEGTLRHLFDAYLDATIQQRIALDLRLIECAIPNQDIDGTVGFVTRPCIYE